MKKITIIDDNSKNQRAEYGASFVDEDKYAEYLIHVEKLYAQSDLSFLEDAACVMVHDTLEDFIDGEFKSDSHKAKERVEEFVQDRNIPQVFFSDGHPMTAEWREDTPDVVYSIKKSEFYLHLHDFVLHYIDTGTIDMRIIAYGKEYKKELMTRWCQTIMSRLTNLSDGDIVDMPNKKEDKEAMQKDLRQIIEGAQPEIGITSDEILARIEDQEMKAGELRANLNKIISNVKKYGKNISSWK